MQATALAPQPGKYLTFMLGKEKYGAPVMKVREIMAPQPITAVPRTPDYLKGVINLRGKLLPALDLRLKLGLAAAEYMPSSCMIVVQVAGEAGGIEVALIVDAVFEVLNLLPPETIPLDLDRLAGAPRSAYLDATAAS